MTKFRLGISDIAGQYYRYKKNADNNLICPLCREAQENELHFVLCSPMLSGIREQFIPAKFYKFPSLFRLSLWWHPKRKSGHLTTLIFVLKTIVYRVRVTLDLEVV